MQLMATEMTAITRLRTHTADVRKTVASAEYPSPGTRNYGAEMSNLKEIINILHEAGYVVDHNLISHLATAITRILLRDGCCFVPKLGLFRARHYLGRHTFHRVWFRPSPLLDLACYAHYGTFESREYLKTGLPLNTEDVELMALFNELAEESQERLADG
jgi:hypothetical protein